MSFLINGMIPEADLPIKSPGATANIRYEEGGKSYKSVMPDVVSAAAAVQNSIDAIVQDAEDRIDSIVRSIGYLPPIQFAPGINVDSSVITVSYNGVTYAPVADAIPFTTSSTFDPSQWRVIQGVSAADLAAPTGSGLVGYKSAPGANTVTVDGKLGDLPASIVDYGARASYADNIGFIQDAIDSQNRGAVLNIPAGNYHVSYPPNNSAGITWEGAGNIIAPIPVSQVNTYRYKKPIAINKEYLWRVYQVLQSTNRGIRCYTYGDSTVEGGFNYIDWGFFLQKLLPDMASARGVQNNFSVTNRGVAGSNLSTWNPTPDIGVNSATPADLVILKCGINDAFGTDRLDLFEQRLRDGLAAIRATSGGDIGSCSILLVGPNSVWDMEHDARNTRWFEQLRSIFEAAAHDYKCAYFDAYAYLQDSSFAAGRWLDTNASGTGLHPTNIGQSWIWGAIMDFIFGDSETLRYKTNQFHNRSSYRGWPTAKNPPDFYPANYSPGTTWEIALAADGFPFTGFLRTDKHADGYLVQSLTPVDGTFSLLIRNGRDTDGFYTPWRGRNTALTFNNGWANFGGVYRTASSKLCHDGSIKLVGVLAPGTLSAGVTIATLPNDHRPVNQHLFIASCSTGHCHIEILANGAINLRKYTGTPQWVSLSGLEFFP